MIRFKYFKRLELWNDIFNNILGDEMFFVSNSVGYEICVDKETGDFIMDITDIGDFPEHSMTIGFVPTCVFIDECGGTLDDIEDKKKCCRMIFDDIKSKLWEYSKKYYITKTEAIKIYGKKIVDAGYGFIGKIACDNTSKFSKKCYLYDKNVIEYHIRKSNNLIAFCHICRQYYDPDKHDGHLVDISVKYNYNANNQRGYANYGFNTLTNICPDCLDKVLKSMNIKKSHVR